jgi:hypothetical protein
MLRFFSLPATEKLENLLERKTQRKNKVQQTL